MFQNEDIQRGSKAEQTLWKGGEKHAEDILYAAFQPPYTLATGL